jgi:hypothetical protein
MGVGLGVSLGLLVSLLVLNSALKDGLLLAIDLEIPYLEIEMDSFVAVELVNSTNATNIFLERFECFTLKHIYKEANCCVDVLAKAGYA